MNEIAKWMIALGSVVAAVGLVVFGIGTSFVRPEASETNLGLILMIGGLVVFFLGGGLYQRTKGPDTSTD